MLVLIILAYCFISCNSNQSIECDEVNLYQVKIAVSEDYLPSNKESYRWVFLTDSLGQTQDWVKLENNLSAELTGKCSDRYDIHTISFNEGFFTDKGEPDSRYYVGVQTQINYPNNGELTFGIPYDNPDHVGGHHFKIRFEDKSKIDTVILLQSISYETSQEEGKIILDFWNRQSVQLYIKNREEDFFRFAEINSTENNEIIDLNSYQLDSTFHYGHIKLLDESVWRINIEGNLENSEKEIALLPFRERTPFVGVNGFDLWMPKNIQFKNYDVFIDDVGGQNSFNKTKFYGTVDEIPLEIPTIDFTFFDKKLSIDGFDIQLSRDANFSEYSLGVNWKVDDRNGTILQWTVTGEFIDGLNYTYPEIPRQITNLSKLKNSSINPKELSGGFRLRVKEFSSDITYGEFLKGVRPDIVKERFKVVR